MTRTSDAFSIFNPFSEKYDTVKKFKQLDAKQKCKVVQIAVISTLATLSMGALGGIVPMVVVRGKVDELTNAAKKGEEQPLLNADQTAKKIEVSKLFYF